MKNGSFLSANTTPHIQVVSSSKGDLVIDLRPGKSTHPYRVLYFLTLFRNDTAEDYLSFITFEEYGKASFLEGGLAGIDVVIKRPGEFQNEKRKAAIKLIQAKNQQDWGAANWWKGYLSGLEMADEVQKSSWFDSKRTEHKLIHQMNRQREKIS